MMASPVEPFALLRDPDTYVACRWDLVADAEGRRYWVDFFCQHVRTMLELGVDVVADARTDVADARTVVADARTDGDEDDVIADARRRAAACEAAFVDFFRRLDADPLAVAAERPTSIGSNGPTVTILTLDVWRDSILREHGFVDPFIDLKDRENARMIGLLPEVCRQLDRLEGESRWLAAVEGVFAGNIFDMGAKATAERFKNESPDFFRTRALLPPRPWLIDDFDAFAPALTTRPHRKCVFFIDNAGSDFLLGALPLARAMARRGTAVVLACNERPTLNDMTVHDVNRWWPRVTDVEPSFADLPISIVSTGTGEPLIDLSRVGPDLNAASADADLVILEGMGRGVESNLDASFTCDAVNLAMLKDPAVAARCGGKVYDVICRFR